MTDTTRGDATRATRIWFAAAGVAMVLTAVAHTLGGTMGPPQPGRTLVEAAMRAFHIPVGGGFSPSYMQLYQSFFFTMPLALAWIGAIHLWLSRLPELTRRAVTAITAVGLIGTTALFALSVATEVMPAFASYGVVEVALAGTLAVNLKAS